MPRGHKLIQGILRALRSPTVKKVIDYGYEKLSPYLGELVLSGAERLRQFGLGDIAEKVTDRALNMLEGLPNTAQTLATLGEEAWTAHNRRKSGTTEEADEGWEASEPYNHSPNATAPNPNVAYKAMATLAGDRGTGKGSGVVVYGNDYPFQNAPKLPQSKLVGRTPQEQAAGKPAHRINNVANIELPSEIYGREVKNTFGYLGAPGVSAELPNPRYSVAGPYFRKVGGDTNIRGAIPAYGIDDPEPRPRVPTRVQPPRKAKTAAAAAKKPRRRMAVAL